MPLYKPAKFDISAKFISKQLSKPMVINSMKSKIINLHQLTAIIEESVIISTDNCVDALIHSINHPYFGRALIVQMEIGNGVILFEQYNYKANSDTICFELYNKWKDFVNFQKMNNANPIIF